MNLLIATQGSQFKDAVVADVPSLAAELAAKVAAVLDADSVDRFDRE